MKTLRSVFLVLILLLPTQIFAQQRILITLIGGKAIEGRHASRSTRTLDFLLRKHQSSWYPLNFSVSGATVSNFSPWGANTAMAATSLLGNVNMIFLGADDWAFGVPLDAFRTNYGAFIDTLGEVGALVVCVTPLWRGSFEGSLNPTSLQTLEDYREVITEECDLRNLPVINGKSLIPNEAKYFQVSEVEPNDLGYRRFARNLSRAAEEIFRNHGLIP